MKTKALARLFVLYYIVFSLQCRIVLAIVFAALLKMASFNYKLVY